MEGRPRSRAARDNPGVDRVAVVWIDSREGIVARRAAGAIDVERLRSDVPPHHRSTGHVRYDPAFRHGGGPQSDDEARRLERVGRFLEEAERRLPPAADLLLLGPGVVHEQLARRIREHDARHHITRDVRCETAPRLTRRQLIARLRVESGEQPRRRTVGAYRWTDPGKQGCHAGLPRRVAARHRRLDAPGPEDAA
jgi:hypothetical protein